MAGGLPAISGTKLMRLLEGDGWSKGRTTQHGVAYTKEFRTGPRVTIIPNRTASLAPGTLAAILGVNQTGLKRDGLLR